MRAGHCPACGSESIRHAESVPAMECGSCGAVFRKRHAPPREGHALGLLEELRDALRSWLVGAKCHCIPGGCFTPKQVCRHCRTRALLSRADALSPVGELRTWQQERAAVIADLRELANGFLTEANGQDATGRTVLARNTRRIAAVLANRANHYERGDHVGASQETAEKETGRG